jgi:recombination protein RecR
MYSKTIQKLIDLFSKFPTIGPRTAARFVFYLIKTPKEEIEKLIKSIEELKDKIKLCPLCFRSFEGEQEICPICSDPKRDKSVICVVEKEVDLESIEKTKKYNGLYFLLDKNGEGIEQRIEKLIERIKKDEKIKEIILALNPTTEGKTMSLFIQRKLKNLGIKTTQLGCGLPMGGELEYADEETLSSALESRR